MESLRIMSNVHPIMEQALKPMAPSRGDRQREIENLLAGFGMDAMEAQEILAAFTVGLNCRYDEDEIPEVMEAVKELNESLQELERTG
jgi:hypothetical protein